MFNFVPHTYFDFLWNVLNSNDALEFLKQLFICFFKRLVSKIFNWFENFHCQLKKHFVTFKISFFYQETIESESAFDPFFSPFDIDSVYDYEHDVDETLESENVESLESENVESLESENVRNSELQNAESSNVGRDESSNVGNADSSNVPPQNIEASKFKGKLITKCP